ncbi:Uncharacterised protein [Acholeplasma oculi]|uniref:DUF3137 domain-containing protein n=1 Tax=Acholeplasma oculi TaxID=35623 RepID=A0A061AFL8_9MOLU|nr:hypothetical protein [Acholeplasma oculi]CDR30346.1 hypothetical protein Aocu_02730 [Acholeplasma oculi]SKC42479.1 hypothetical protein SAMN02745122_0898 [Acholeplasma oculi]SUT88843.1 Uncharacterised protein [Acholeplasma oculi]
MGTNSLDIQKQYQYYLKKRNHFLFFIIGSVFVLALIYIILLQFQIDDSIILTIQLPLAVILSVYILIKKQKFNYYVMQLEYYTMLKDDLGPIHAPVSFFSKSFVEKIQEDGYHEGYQNKDFILYYQFIPKLKNIVKSGHVLIVLLFAKHPKFDFYSDEVDKIIQNLYMNYKDEKKVRKQLVLQFKKYESFDLDVKMDLDGIINFKAADNYLIHLNVGYFTKTNEIYYLRPKTRFPNKYYYVLSELIQHYAGIKNEETHEKK